MGFFQSKALLETSLTSPEQEGALPVDAFALELQLLPASSLPAHPADVGLAGSTAEPIPYNQSLSPTHPIGSAFQENPDEYNLTPFNMQHCATGFSIL